VAVTDAFLGAVRRNERYELVDPRDGRIVRRVSARTVFDRIVDAAWSTGDPGLLFLDAINRANPTPALGDIEATNPCGEVPLLPNEACTLGSVNLSRMLTRGKDGWHIDWPSLDRTVEESIRFLDNVVSAGRYPTAEIQSAVERTRKIGLGVMGFSELLIRLGVGYGSERALALADQIMARISTRARSASAALARSRGVFPAWSGSVFQQEGRRVRNAPCTSIAPTGTISIIAGTTSSIEPLFALAYRRVGVLDGATLTEINPLFLEAAEEWRLLTPEVRATLEQRGALGRDESVPANVRDLFATALEIEPAQHLRVQAAFQRHVDNAVSKTINLPEDAPRSAVSEAYLLAHELGLKGVTVYRYGTRGEQVLQLGAGEHSFAWEHFARCDPGDCRL
jgi:ribonucleoside-diphosphate reductase alpha chain